MLNECSLRLKLKIFALYCCFAVPAVFLPVTMLWIAVDIMFPMRAWIGQYTAIDPSYAALLTLAASIPIGAWALIARDEAAALTAFPLDEEQVRRRRGSGAR